MNSEVYQPEVTRSERRLKLRGVDYCSNEWGDPGSPLLVYLHGWADTGSTFQFVVDALSNDWFVVAPDWRGFGRTQHSCESYWFPDYLADLHEFLQHYSPAKPVLLVGHSMGANIGSLYAGVFPDRVQAFVNVEGFGLPDSDPADAPQRYREWIEACEAPPLFSEYATFSALEHRIKKRSAGISKAAAAFVAREWSYEDADGRIRLRADAKHKSPNAVLYRRAEAEACWSNIRAEVLLISGGKSPFPTYFDPAGTLQFPGGQTEVIAGAGHMIHFEAATALAAAIERFLTKPL